LPFRLDFPVGPCMLIRAGDGGGIAGIAIEQQEHAFMT
jgi:hypothetical protein